MKLHLTRRVIALPTAASHAKLFSLCAVLFLLAALAPAAVTKAVGAESVPATLNRAITLYDIAPTLANYLGIKQPSAAIGKPLAEVLGN